MIARILAIATAELRIAIRNRWVAIASILMLLFSLALTFAGSAPTGALGVDLLTVAVASMTTLSVYLVPLLALLLAFDAIVGEVERGGLALVLTYPVSRTEVLVGKFLAHIAALTLAIALGFGTSGLAAWATGGVGPESLVALVRLTASAVALGATFLAIGYALSALARSPGAAAGLAITVWVVFVVLYDLGLLGALVYDGGGTFTRQIFPWLLAANPADAFRLFNLAGSDQLALATGLTGAAAAMPAWAAKLSLLAWPVVAMGLARLALRRVEP
jgi:Cu-processing system permease protein